MEAKYRSIVWKFYVFEFLAGFHFFSAVLTPMFSDWAGYGLAGGILVAQVLQSWYAFCTFLMEIPTGVVADRLGRKHSLTMGRLVLIPAALVYGSIPNVGVFALGELLFSCGAALTSGADKAYLYDWLKLLGKGDKATEVWGKSRSAHMIGMLVAAPIGGLMAGAWGINYPMLLTSVPCALSAIIAWTLPEPPIPFKKTAKTHFHFAVESMVEVWNDRTLLRWTANSILVGTTAYFVIWLYQPVMKTLGFPIEWFGFVHTGIVLVEIAVSSQIGRLTRVFGSTRTYLYFTAFVTGASFILVAICPNVITFGLFLVFAGGFGYTRGEFMGIAMNELIESHNRATVNSTISMFRQLSRAIANIVVGIVASVSLSPVLFVLGLIPFISFLFSLHEDKNKVEKPESISISRR